MRRSTRNRVPLMAAAVAALLAALWGGLLRLGWNWPVLHAPLPMSHGPLIIGGFLGTLIGLERAVALDRRWAYLAPLLSGVGAILLIALGVAGPGALLLTLGSLLLVIVFAAIIRKQPALFTVIMGLGAVAWLIGNVLWLSGRAIPQVVLWWSGFLVITIVGERLELSRLIRLTPWRHATFLIALGLFVGGMIASIFSLDAGMRLSGAGMIALAIWLGRYDIARRTVRKPGLTRFIAIALLLGYVWLAIGGGLALAAGGVMAGFAYDALLHAVLIGFVISMVFGHAPIIFPSVLGIPAAWNRSAYLPLVLLHLSLVVRVGGDLLESIAVRRWGGLLNAVAILLFFGNTARMAWQARRREAHVLREPATTQRQATPRLSAPRS
jgi:hypothetical protein